MGKTIMKKIGMHIPVYAFVLILLLGSVATTNAEDFTFNVPVAIYNMPAYTTGRVQCRCDAVVPKKSGPGSTTPGKPQMSDQGISLVAGGFKEFLIANGTFVGTVTVKFNAGNPSDGAPPAASATDWACTLFLFDKNMNRWVTGSEVLYNRSKPYYPSDKGYLK